MCAQARKCFACVVTNVTPASHNVSAYRKTSTLMRAPTRATACGSRVAQMWDPWGGLNLEREIHNLRDARGITNVSTTSHNFTASC